MKNSIFYYFSRLALAMGLVLFGLQLAQAQDYFDGTTGDRLWSDPANWRDGRLPTAESLGVIICSDVVVDVDVSIPNLADDAYCNLTVQEGKMLRVDASICWDNGGDFVLEDGAQLIHFTGNPSGVEVLVKKRIQAQSDDHLWYLIASPVVEDVTPSVENGLLAEPESGYALYSYDAEHLEWVNYKNFPFTLSNGYGYLYANALDTVLQFNGTTRSADMAAEVGLVYHPENGNMAGCNFVGNPLASNAIVSKSYYAFGKEHNEIRPVAHSSGTPVSPCDGLIVESKAENDAVSFSNSSLSYQVEPHYLEISVAKSNAPDEALDWAILSLDSCDNLAKYQFFEDVPQIYFTKDGQDLSILGVDSIDMQPVKFKAVEDGAYTFHFDFYGLYPDYLQLIDNKTGTRTDLLTMSDYTFSASTNDFASRFKLVFDPHYSVGEYEGALFASLSNGSIIINTNEIPGSASLRVVDMIGRVVMTRERDTMNRVSTNGMAPGVYVLQLCTENGMRTQKIVVNN